MSQILLETDNRKGITQHISNAAINKMMTELYGGSSAAAYMGQVATGTHLPDIPSTTNKQAMSRTGHYARDTISSLQLVLPNYYVNISSAGAETAIGSNAATIEASVEYPVGTFNRVTFSGVNTGSIPAGASLISDALTIAIPTGALFFVRTYYTNPDGIALFNTGMGSQVNDGVSGIANLVVTAGSITSGNFAYYPTAIIAMTTKPSVGILGDSRMVGLGETFSATTYLRGHVERMLGSSLPLLNLALPSDRVQWFLASHAQRSLLLQYCSHILCNYGINDIINGARTAVQILADLQTLYALTGITGKPLYQTTLEPKATSSDSFATETNQTPDATNSVRVTLNTSLRAGTAGVSGLIDWDITTVESFATSGIYQAPTGTGSPPPSVAITTDGLHLNTSGVLRVVSQGQQIAGLFTR